MGLDPRKPFDPWTESKGRILKKEGNFIFELNSFGSKLDYTLLGSRNLEEWDELDNLPIFEGGTLHFSLLEKEPQFYRLRISTPK